MPQVSSVCQYLPCSTPFLVTAYKRRIGVGLYCSDYCRSAARRVPLLPIPCGYCGSIFLVRITLFKNGEGKYCSKACRVKGLTLPLPERFWNKVIRCSHEQDCIYCCWTWTAGHDKAGYPTISITHSKPGRASRVGWELWHNRPLPAHKLAAHYCNNPRCINPQHIYPATTQENAADAIRAGTLAHGSTHHHSTLTEEDILRIFTLTAQGVSRYTITQQMPVRYETVCRILRREAWRHVPIPDALLTAITRRH